MNVNIFDETGALDHSIQEIIKKTAAVCGEVLSISGGCSVDILVTDAESIRVINFQKRNVDAATDVLSFPMTDYEKECIRQPDGFFLGDIVICLEKIEFQANEYGHSVEREAGFLTAHGILHLIGYDHISKDDEKKMFEMQDIILNKMELYR